VPLLHMESFFFGKKPKSQFLVEFQSFVNKLFLGRFWAVLGGFCCIGNG
jgi:hypothetical protein